MKDERGYQVVAPQLSHEDIHLPVGGYLITQLTHIETTMSMKECYVFDGDGRFTGQVIDMTKKPEIREIPKIRPTLPLNTMLRYNILLNAFTNTNRGW